MRRLMLLLAAGFALPAQAQTYLTHFQEIFDNGSESDMRAVVQTQDRGYAYAGTTPNGFTATAWNRPLLTKLDTGFNLQWATTYLTLAEIADPNAFGPELTALDMIETADGGYLISGRAIYEGMGQIAGFMLRTDAAGGAVWFRTYPGTNALNSIAESPDGFIAVGESDAAQRRAVLMATEPDGQPRCGQEVWSVKRRDPGEAMYREVVPYVGGLFAAVGTTGVIRWESDVLVTTFDDRCNIALNRVYGDATTTGPNGIAFGLQESGEGIAWDQTTNHLVITGTHRTACIDVCVRDLWRDILAFSIDKAGTVNWAKRFDVQGQADHGLDITVGRGLGKRTRAPQVWITGRAASDHLSPGAVSDDGFLLQLDRLSGALQGFEVFGDADFDELHSVITNADANVVMVGDTDSFNPGYADTYVIERFASVMGLCRDLPVEPRVVDVDLPIIKPYQRDIALPSLDEPLVAVAPPVAQRVLCPKVRVR